MQEKKKTISSANLTSKDWQKLMGGSMGLSHTATNLPLPIYIPMQIGSGTPFTGRVNLLLDERNEIMGHTEVGLSNFTRFIQVVPEGKTDEEVKELISKFRSQPTPTGKNKLSYEGFIPTIQAPAIKGMQEQTLVSQRYTLTKSADNRVLRTTFTAAGRPIAADATIVPGAFYEVSQLNKSKEFADKIVAYLSPYYEGEWEKDVRAIYE